MIYIYLAALQTDEQREKMERLYNSYKGAMKYEALFFFRNEDDADDAVHMAFLKIIDVIDNIRESPCHKTRCFLVTVVRNICIDILRDRKKNKIVGYEDLEYEIADNKSVESMVANKYDAKKIQEAIDKLPDIYKDVFVFRYSFDYNDKKIAEVLGISHGTARKRLERARNMLANILEKEGVYSEK